MNCPPSGQRAFKRRQKLKKMRFLAGTQSTRELGADRRSTGIEVGEEHVGNAVSMEGIGQLQR